MHSGKRKGWSGKLPDPGGRAAVPGGPAPGIPTAGQGSPPHRAAWIGPEGVPEAPRSDAMARFEPGESFSESRAAGSLHDFDLGMVPASVTPPRTWRHAAWFAVISSAATLGGLMFATTALVGNSPGTQAPVHEFPDEPRGGHYPSLPVHDVTPPDRFPDGGHSVPVHLREPRHHDESAGMRSIGTVIHRETASDSGRFTLPTDMPDPSENVPDNDLPPRGQTDDQHDTSDDSSGPDTEPPSPGRQPALAQLPDPAGIGHATEDCLEAISSGELSAAYATTTEHLRRGIGALASASE